jgi:hypothetical protein
MQNGMLAVISQGAWVQEAVRRIGSDEGLDAQRKAYLMQNIMASRYIVAQQRRMQSTSVGHVAAGSRRCFHDPRQHILGCSHYKRGCAPLPLSKEAGSLLWLSAG